MWKVVSLRREKHCGLEREREREREEEREKLGEEERQVDGGKAGEEPHRSFIGPSQGVVDKMKKKKKKGLSPWGCKGGNYLDGHMASSMWLI